MGMNLGLKGKMVEDLEFLKTAVDRLQGLIDAKLQLNSQTPIDMKSLQAVEEVH